MARQNSEILNQLKAINEHIIKIEVAQAEISQALARVAMEQISQRESQFRLENRVINHINTEEEAVGKGH